MKRCRVAELIEKQDPYKCCLQKTHVRSKDIHRMKVRRWKKGNENGNEMKCKWEESWDSNTYTRQNTL